MRSRPRFDSLLWESGMIRDTTDVKRRVMTQPLVVRNHKPLHGWFATALFLAGSIASSGATAAIGEQFCTHGGQDPQKGDSVACYSDDGCRFAASLGAEPVRNFSPSSTPFALARGKITGMGGPRRPQRKPRAPASVVLACEMIKERARPDLIDCGFLRIRSSSRQCPGSAGPSFSPPCGFPRCLCPVG